jgi:hypothetical protein
MFDDLRSDNSHLPGVVHHEHEVVVVVHARGHGGVVVIPFALSDGSISVLVAEGGQELREHLIGGHFARLNLGVHGAVVHGAQIASSDARSTVNVEFVEGRVDAFLAHLVGASAHAEEELIEVDVAIVVGVEALEEHGALVLGKLAAHILKAPVELLLVELAVALHVHDSERAAETTDGLGTAGHEVFTHLLDDFTTHVLTTWFAASGALLTLFKVHFSFKVINSKQLAGPATLLGAFLRAILFLDFA